MAEESEEQEKTEDPTPRRLQKAKDEGQVPRSRELTTYLLLLAGVLCLWISGSAVHEQLSLVMEGAFVFERARAFDTGVMLTKAAELAELSLLTLVPLFVMLGSVALVAPTMLGGLVISGKNLQPKIGKLNPIKGLKRLFSVQVVVELAKVIAKAVLVGTVAIYFMVANVGRFMALMDQSIHEALASGMRLAAVACALMVVTLIAVVLIDVPFQIWSHTKKLRMTKDEVKKEHKETEGDPQLKSQIRSVQQSMARKRMMSKVPEADVIVTNPTSFAVALHYREDSMAAPRLVAKGGDQVAQRIRDLGREHGVPQLQAPPLARALYAHVDLDEEIPRSLYTAVAEVLAWAFRLKRVRGSRSPLPPEPNVDVPSEMDEMPQPDREGVQR